MPPSVVERPTPVTVSVPPVSLMVPPLLFLMDSSVFSQPLRLSSIAAPYSTLFPSEVALRVPLNTMAASFFWSLACVIVPADRWPPVWTNAPKFSMLVSSTSPPSEADAPAEFASDAAESAPEVWVNMLEFVMSPVSSTTPAV